MYALTFLITQHTMHRNMLNQKMLLRGLRHRAGENSVGWLSKKENSHIATISPTSGDTNVTVVGYFKPGTQYDCWFGHVRSPALPLARADKSGVYEVSCISPVSLIAGKVRFR